MQLSVRTTSLRLIRDLEIPMGMVACLSQISPARISDFCRNRPLPGWQESRIVGVIEQIGYVWSAFRRGAPGVKLLIDNPTILKKLVAACEQSAAENELIAASTEASEAFKAAVAQKI